MLFLIYMTISYVIHMIIDFQATWNCLLIITDSFINLIIWNKLQAYRSGNLDFLPGGC